MEELVITIHEAKGLLAADFGGKSDPYVTLALLNSNEQPIPAAGNYKTKVMKKTISPSWEEQFQFGRVFDIRNATFLQCELFDHEVIGKHDKLGKVTIPLTSTLETSATVPLSQWYPLERMEGMKKVTGEIRISLYRQKPNTEEIRVAIEETKDSEHPPNQLIVTVISARGLRALDRGGTSDPMVIIKCNGQTYKTSKKKKTLTPQWNQKFRIPVADVSKSIQFIVEDHDLTVNDFMGQVELPLTSLANGQVHKQHHELLNKKMQREQTLRGELELEIQWIFNSDVSEADTKEGNFLSNTITSLGNALNISREEDSDEEDGMEIDEPEKSEEEIKKEKEEQEKAKKELEQELSNIQIQSGDYTVNVHIIEARELKPKDATGTSDPIVYVTCLDEKQNTVIKHKTLNCVWDELLIYSFRNVDKAEIEMGRIEIEVMDANSIQRNELIGTIAFDTSYVYAQKDHEVYRKWIALTNPGCDGIQGYLKCSLTVLGPQDKLKVHDVEKEIKEERDNEKQGVRQVIMPPSIQQDVQFLVASVYYAEALPPLDFDLLSSKGKGGIDAYIGITVGGNPELRTKIRTLKGRRSDLNPLFNSDLWIPIRLPTMSSNISVAVKDWDRLGKNDTVGHFYYNLQLVLKCGQISPFWMNLYGAPINLVLPNESVKKHMNTFPETGTAYRGRVLMGFRIEENNDGSIEESPHRKKISAISSARLPPTRMYQLRALVVAGAEIPKFSSLRHVGQNSKMSVMVSCGLTELCTERAPNRKGVVEWNQYMHSDPVAFPEDLDQVPDIFVYLCKGKESDRKLISYRRFKAKDIFDDEMKTGAKWLVMKEDSALNALSDDEFPGSILIRIGFGTIETAEASVQDWTANVQEIQRRIPYQVRVHLYQGRGLPAADSNGLLDPYVKVRLLGQQVKTEIKRKTRDPCWYESKLFDVELPPLEYAPQISLRLFDWEKNPLDPDDYCGVTFIDMKDAFTRTTQDTATLPDPKWYPLFLQEAGDSEGEILASVELIRKKYPDEVIPPPPSISPKMRTAYLELTILGLRNLEAYQFLPIQLPFVEFFLGSKDHANQEMSTNKSKRPSGSNPNFLQRIVREVKLPEKALFAPRLNVTVRDTRLGGFHTPVIGTCAIDMVDKLPWSENYTPPQSDSICPANMINMDTPSSPVANTSMDTQPLLGSPSIPDEDTGAGVFGALKTMGVDIIPPEPPETILSIDPDPTDTLDEDDPTPKYLIHREVLKEELETKLATAPFETYPLFLGQKFGGLKARFGEESYSSYRKVGLFKGLVRVMLNKDDAPLLDMQRLLSSQPYQIRIYVLGGYGFRPMDDGIGGRPGKSDPYLKLSLGKQTINDRKNYKENETDPDFYSLYEFKGTLPGESQLRIEVKDYDLIGKDDLIGETTIDLEDRLFDSRWVGLGEEYETSERYRLRPVEKRTLYVPTSTATMGTLECWIDIMSQAEATAYPALDISLPPPVEMELRVVIWKTKDVVSFDTFTDQNDLFCRCWVEGSEKQDTDVHWRCKKGKGSFNWRMKFPITLGHNQLNSKFPYFHIQLWDKDVISFSDAIAEGLLDLGDSFRKAYKTNSSVLVFEDKKRRNPDEQPKSKQASENEDAIQSIKELTGLWDVDPSDSSWIKLERMNHESQVREPMGEVNVTMEVVPKSIADMMPVGFGRSEPNNSPFLPPPNGRLSFSMNPFYVFNELLGPKVCTKIMLCLCCVLLLLLVYFLAPLINIGVTLAKN